MVSKGERFYGYFLTDISDRVNPWTYVKKKMDAVQNLLDKCDGFSVKNVYM